MFFSLVVHVLCFSFLLHAIQVTPDGQQGEIITMINTDDNPHNDSDGDDEYSEDDVDDGDSDNGSQSSVERMQRGSEDDFSVVDSGSEVGMSKLLQESFNWLFMLCVVQLLLLSAA